jgi:hypothetical protein
MDISEEYIKPIIEETVLLGCRYNDRIEEYNLLVKNHDITSILYDQLVKRTYIQACMVNNAAINYLDKIEYIFWKRWSFMDETWEVIPNQDTIISGLKKYYPKVLLETHILILRMIVELEEIKLRYQNHKINYDDFDIDISTVANETMKHCFIVLNRFGPHILWMPASLV